MQRTGVSYVIIKAHICIRNLGFARMCGLVLEWALATRRHSWHLCNIVRLTNISHHLTDCRICLDNQYFNLLEMVVTNWYPLFSKLLRRAELHCLESLQDHTNMEFHMGVVWWLPSQRSMMQYAFPKWGPLEYTFLVAKQLSWTCHCEDR